MPIQHQFAIRKIVLKNGEEHYIPLTRTHRKLFKNKWNRLVLVEYKVVIQDIDFDVTLTREDCQQRIEKYKEQLVEACSKNVKTIDYQLLPNIKL